MRIAASPAGAAAVAFQGALAAGAEGGGMLGGMLGGMGGRWGRSVGTLNLHPGAGAITDLYPVERAIARLV